MTSTQQKVIRNKVGLLRLADICTIHGRNCDIPVNKHEIALPCAVNLS